MTLTEFLRKDAKEREDEERDRKIGGRKMTNERACDEPGAAFGPIRIRKSRRLNTEETRIYEKNFQLEQTEKT
jgi:hypothetical protein